MANAKTEDLRKKAKQLLEQAKKIEEEASLKLGMAAAKYFVSVITMDEFIEKAIELGFEVTNKPTLQTQFNGGFQNGGLNES